MTADPEQAMSGAPRELLIRTILRLRAELARAEEEADEATSNVATVAKMLDDANAERDALRERVRALLLSADAAWERDGGGHDWREACAAARALLSPEPSPPTAAPEKQEGQ